jgi:solute carrier family 35 (GDP-fucose transporter), member C1
MYYTWVKSAEAAQSRPAVPPRDPVDLEKAETALAKHAEGSEAGGEQK